MLEPSAAIRVGRMYAADLMSDTFTAYSPSGNTTDADGYEVPGFTDEGSTLGKLQGGSSAATDPSSNFVTIGGERRLVMYGGLHIPIDAPLPTAGDRGTGWEYVCTAVGPESDPSLVGRRYLVVNVPSKSYATARRLDVVEV